MNCEKNGCTNSATMCCVIFLWAEGYEKTNRAPASVNLGLDLCDICAGEAKRNQL